MIFAWTVKLNQKTTEKHERTNTQDRERLEGGKTKWQELDQTVHLSEVPFVIASIPGSMVHAREKRKYNFCRATREDQESGSPPVSLLRFKFLLEKAFSSQISFGKE